MPKTDKLPDAIFLRSDGELMEPQGVLSALRDLYTEAFRIRLLGNDLQAEYLYVKAADGFEALDMWLSDGRHLPADWADCKPEDFSDTAVDGSKVCECGSSKRVHDKFNVNHKFNEGTTNA
jgi:hypothetical protein